MSQSAATASLLTSSAVTAFNICAEWCSDVQATACLPELMPHACEAVQALAKLSSRIVCVTHDEGERARETQSLSQTALV